MALRLHTCLLLAIAVIPASASLNRVVAQEYFIDDAISPSPNLPQVVRYELELDDDTKQDVVSDSEGSHLSQAAEPSPECLCDCLWCRPNLLGDWHGKKTALAQHGIIWDGQLTQFHQGVTEGGARRDFDYGGKLDQFILFDFEKLGLCCHLKAVMHVETRFGEAVIGDATPFAPVNANMLYPKPNQNDTAITGLQFELALTDEWALTFGKINTLDLLYSLYPQTGRGVDGFMNFSMLAPLTVARTLPQSFLGAGLLKRRGQQIEGGFLVYDSNNITTTSGFDVLFDNGANLAAFWRIFTNWGGRPGSHLLLGSYATGDYTSLDPTGWVIIPPGGVVPAQESGSWHATYILEQKLWVDPCNPNRNIALYSPWSVADPDTSPFEWACNVALQGQGLCCCRENDTIGVGYFYTGLSNQFKNLLQPVAPLDDVHGFEMYYNAEVTPWFHLTADMQIVEPALRANDTAVVFGLRGKINL